jgi:hypothetical protein
MFELALCREVRVPQPFDLRQEPSPLAIRADPSFAGHQFRREPQKPLAPVQMIFVQHWFEELKRLAPTH